jgi:predicted MFS family arabinose efflux permease
VTAIVPPAEAAAVRRLVDTDELAEANAMLALTWSATNVIGMSLGGLVASLGPAVALAIDAATFGLAALVHATLPSMAVSRDDLTSNDDVVSALRATPRDATLALRDATGDRELFSALLGKAPFALASGAAWVAMNALVFSHGRASDASVVVGVLLAIRGAGTGIGPAVTARLAKRGLSDRRSEHLARGVLVGSFLALAFVVDRTALAAVALVWGMATGTNWVLSHTRLQARASDRVLGRLAAFDELLVAVATSAGAIFGALVTESASPRLSALTCVPLAIVAWTVARLATDEATRTRPSRVAS